MADETKQTNEKPDDVDAVVDRQPSTKPRLPEETALAAPNTDAAFIVVVSVVDDGVDYPVPLTSGAPDEYDEAIASLGPPTVSLGPKRWPTLYSLVFGDDDLDDFK